jgi:hypothetical protein
MSASALSVEMHSRSADKGAQGNLLNIVARHQGTVPWGAQMFFYAIDADGQPGYIGKTDDVDDQGYWSIDWIAAKPSNYQVYAVLRTEIGSLELARSSSKQLEIIGSAISIDRRSADKGAQGNLLKIVARHEGKVPWGAHMFFYALDADGQPGYIGETKVADDQGYWSIDWIATKPSNYQVYAVLRTEIGSLELARSSSKQLKIIGSAISVDQSTPKIGVPGNRTSIVVRQQGTLPRGAYVFFHVVDASGQPGFIGKIGSADDLGYWRIDWTPSRQASYQVYAVLRKNDDAGSLELARTGMANLFVTTQGGRLFQEAIGTYHALLPGAKRPMLTVHVSNNGVLSGRLIADGLVYAFTKQLAPDGSADIETGLGSHPSLRLLLQYDLSSKLMTGSYQFAGQQPIAFTLMLPAYAGTGANVSPLSKKTANALLVSESDGTNPLGHGYFRATFDAKGGARVAGKMPDGRRLTGYAPALGTGVAGETTLPLSVVWKGKALATLIGDLEVRENAGDSVPLLEGAVEWNAPADPKRKVLPGEIQANFSVVGNLWSPVAGRSPLTSTGDSVNFTFQADSGANILSSALSAVGAWGAAAQPAISGLPAGTKWKYAPKTGIFTGQIPGSPGRFVFEGLLVPKSEHTVDGNLLFGGGFLIGKGASAPVELLEAD